MYLIPLKVWQRFFCDHRYENNPEVLEEAREKGKFEHEQQLDWIAERSRTQDVPRKIVGLSSILFQFAGELCHLCGKKRIVIEVTDAKGQKDAHPPVGNKYQVVVL